MVLKFLNINLGTRFQTKFLWAVIPVVFIIILIFGISSGLISAYQLKKQMDVQFTHIAQARASLLVEPIWNLELERAKQLIEDLVTSDDIIGARVELEDEVLSVSSGEKNSLTFFNTVTTPIVFSDTVKVKQLGTFTMTYSGNKVVSILVNKIIESVIFSILLSTLVSLSIYREVRMQVIRPLDLMTNTIRDSHRENKRYRIDWYSDCEFGEVVQNFNNMQKTLEQEEEKLRQANKKLDYIAFTDALTGLPNRACCMLDMDEMFDNGVPAFDFALVHMDLDNFKKINDTLGHDAGDHLLATVGYRLSLIVADHGRSKAYRWGGDEFIIIFDVEKGSPDQFCAEITDLMSVPLVYKSSSVWPSASVGAAVYPKDGKDFTSLMISADLALYETKESGRDNYHFFTQKLKEQADDLANIEADFQVALERGQLFLAFQPQVESKTFNITGLEALIRWRHPERGILHPAAFLHALEDTRMAPVLGKFVYDQACKAVRSWLDQNIHFGRVAINLSSQHIKMGSAITDFYETLERYDLETKYLTVEVTESLFLNDANQNGLALINELHSNGVRIELDDFGTGFAALSHLSSLPIDGLKIDRSFTQLMLSDEKKAIIIQSLFSMTRLLRIGLVCEGVETEKQLAKLQTLGSCSVQGYFTAKPMNFADVTNWMKLQKNRDFLALKSLNSRKITNIA